jgi:hypothetical protein
MRIFKGSLLDGVLVPEEEVMLEGRKWARALRKNDATLRRQSRDLANG